MSRDPTTAEKAERLGLHCHPARATFPWGPLMGGAGPYYTSEEVAALYAERFPEPVPTTDDLPTEWTITIPAGPVTLRLGRHPDGYIVEDADGRVLLDTTKPTPDYRAALEAFVEPASDLDEQLAGLESTLQDGAFNALHDLRAALTHARKVLHGS